MLKMVFSSLLFSVETFCRVSLFNLNKVIFSQLKLGDEFDLVRYRRELTIKSC